MSDAKIIYFNWHKLNQEPRPTEGASLFVRVNPCGELLVDRPDLYDYVADIAADGDHIETCDRAFRAFNRVEDGDMPNSQVRSMCVGDLVVFDDGRLFVCQGCGWKEFVGHSLKFWALPKVTTQEVSAETRIARGI